MNYDASLLSYFLHASLVVKCVMLILVTASVFSWAYILQRHYFFKEMNDAATEFEGQFWSGENLTDLYVDGNKRRASLVGLEAIFNAGFKEFLKFREQPGATTDLIMNNTKRAMHVAQMREQDKLETNLPFFAIVGSTSPYVGLLGTVWGIMQALRSLANVQQATIAMVAPGVAEALIATAIGLFAAIPAVIAYNRFVTEMGRLMNRYDAFQEEFTNILIRQFRPTSVPSQRSVVME